MEEGGEVGEDLCPPHTYTLTNHTPALPPKHDDTSHCLFVSSSVSLSSSSSSFSSPPPPFIQMCVASHEVLLSERVEPRRPPVVEFNTPSLFKSTRRTSLMFELRAEERKEEVLT